MTSKIFKFFAFIGAIGGKTNRKIKRLWPKAIVSISDVYKREKMQLDVDVSPPAID